MTILPLTYLGHTDYFAALLGDECVIDLGEHYVKQSYRNRCEILSAGGVVPLTVNVVKGGSLRKQPMRDMRIDYSKRWQHQQWMAIVSAYRSAPFFDHYADRFEPFFGQRYEFLADLNTALLETLLPLLGATRPLRFSDTYLIPAEGDRDLRGAFEPLHRAPDGTLLSGTAAYDPYDQVFADRFPFAPCLSVLDLLFCEGPAAGDLLRRHTLR